MLRSVFFIPTLLLSIFVYSQKKNGKINVENAGTVLKGDIQKNMEALNTIHLSGNTSSTASFIASVYKKNGLQPFIDGGTYFQPFTLGLGKEIKPASVLKINGIILEPGTDYWPFAFCGNSFFAGTVVWDGMEINQPYLYDLKPMLEKNKTISTSDLLKHLKAKAIEVAAKKVSAILVYNSSYLNDSLNFFASDTTESTKVPVIYFTRSGIKKLKNESTIANAIDARIVLGEKFFTSENVIACINNNSANTVVITTLNSNLFGSALTLELARLLNEACNPIKKTNAGLNTADYTNNNYLFVNINEDDSDNLGSAYFLEYLPNTININYAINIGVTGAIANTGNLLTINECNTSKSWNAILRNFDSVYNCKIDSSLICSFPNTPFYKKNIPVIYISNPSEKSGQKNKTIPDNNCVNALHYILQLIGSANKHGKLPFNKTKE